MKFQAKIDGIQAGQPFEAPDLAVAEKDAARTWEALRCGDALLTTNGESLVVVEVSHDCDENAVPYVSDGALGHGWECGVCGAFLQAG